MDNIFYSSFIAGSFQTLFGHPLDTIKTRIQLKNKSGAYLTKELFKNEGILGLYKGATFPLLGGCLLNGILFSTEHQLLYICNQNHIYSGFISGIFSSLIMCPVELIKCKFQNNIYNKNNLYNKNNPTNKNNLTNKLTFKKLYNSYQQKQFKLYNGLSLTLARDSIGFSIYFGSYNYLQSKKYDPLLNGGIAGMLSWIYSYPFDTIKTIQQTNDLSFKEAYKKIKLKQLTKGIYLVLIRSFIVNAGIFYSFENIKNIL